MPRALITAEDLEHITVPNKSTELVRGQLVVREPPGAEHGFVTLRIAAAIARWVDDNQLGAAFAAETGFKIFTDPDTVRAPDASFVTASRLPVTLPRGFLSIAPDLVVEVVSPSDRPGEVLSKVGDWIEAGSRLVWVVDPPRSIARVYRADGSESTIQIGGSLEGEDVLRGFSVALARVLQR
ncbi:MAG TPA: Uma2 family endonuclease [Gemmatimonadaceae bacterium]|nr:Uma2 family endonuclease [Gemmatimonadaceae bacterium]